MSNTIQAYPLQWPVGWQRAARRGNAGFRRGHGAAAARVDLSTGLNRLYRELRQLGVREADIVVSSNLKLRMDGMPYADQPFSAKDPGVAVYWMVGKHQRCIAIDRYERLPDNLAAIAATLEAMRAIERHGGAEILDRAFTGFTALPAPEQWFQVLGVPASADRAAIEAAHNRLAMQHHPDRGGSGDAMTRINVARDDGLAQLR